jgi:uncharacterized protein YdhG (YjbR/CyaY superfamily)
VTVASASSSATSAKHVAADVREYLAALPPVSRRVMRQLRTIIRGAAPGAVEGFSYRIPGFRIEGRPLVWYAAFQRHCSLYPITDAIKRAHATALKRYETSKGTVRFPLDQPLPVTLIRKLVRARMTDLRAARASTRRRPAPAAKEPR